MACIDYPHNIKNVTVAVVNQQSLFAMTTDPIFNVNV